MKENVEKEKAVLVDVREKKEWEDGHIKGVVFLPLSDIQDGLTEEELKRLPNDMLLYIHCVVHAQGPSLAATARDGLE